MEVQPLQPLPLLADPATDLDETETEGVELQARATALDQKSAQCVEQPVGGGMQQQAELIGPEAVAAEAIRKAGGFKGLEPQLGLAAAHIPVVERKWREVGA